MEEKELCTCDLGTALKGVGHIHEKFDPVPPKIYDSVLDAIGRTPLIRINKTAKDEGLECQLLAKC